MDFEPRIRIDKVEDIRILICHLIYALGCPLSKDQIIEITSLEDAVNYFDVTAALDTVTEKLCTVEELNGMPVYSNTELGIRAAKELSDIIPLSIREKMFAEAVRVYTRDAEKNKSPIVVRYALNVDGSCTVGVSAKDKESGKQLFFFNLNAESQEEAEKIKHKLSENPNAFIEYVEKYFK
ncbi:MAG: DUF4364 family protein [Oscillospiraceae bacterium]|nr:DUF4364 family protein [Oscillospiraceae bacterium]